MDDIKEMLNISKSEDDLCRFTCIGVRKEDDKIVISMHEYAKNLEKLDIRKGKSLEELMDTVL